jgi:hypothetical protein
MSFFSFICSYIAAVFSVNPLCFTARKHFKNCLYFSDSNVMMQYEPCATQVQDKSLQVLKFFVSQKHIRNAAAE